MRKTTNSAGFTGAMPISTVRMPGVADLRRVVLLVALDEERLAGRAAEQRAVAPDPAQEHRDGALAPRPTASWSFGSKTTQWVPARIDSST